MTPIHTGREEALLIYGGYGSNNTALGDCWRMDLHQHPHSWVRCSHLELGPRCGHQAVVLDNQVMLVGGRRNTALDYADKVLFLRVAPSSLLELCLEYITK